MLQSLPRLLTLYFAFGSKMAAAKTTTQKMRNAHTQVGYCGSNLSSQPAKQLTVQDGQACGHANVLLCQGVIHALYHGAVSVCS